LNKFSWTSDTRKKTGIVIDGFALLWIPHFSSSVFIITKVSSKLFCEKTKASHLGEAEGLYGFRQSLTDKKIKFLLESFQPEPSEWKSILGEYHFIDVFS